MSENITPDPSNLPDQPQQTEETKPATNSARLTLLAIVVGVGVMIWRAPSTAYAVGAFLITLGVLVFVHEWGHYQFARWAGMKVNRFGIGFPPWLFTVRRNDIDYSLGALPIGGMVDIAGLGSEEEMVAAAKGAEFSTVPSRPNVPRGQRQFQDASLGWRFWTLFAGPLMNFLLAIILFIGIYSIAGVPLPAATSTVRTVMPGSPAQAAGILAGDRIVAVNNKPTTETKVISETITASKGAPVTVRLEREGQVIEKTLRPAFEERPTADGKGTERALQIGVGFRLIVKEYVKVGIKDAIIYGWGSVLEITTSIKDLLVRAVTLNLSKSDKGNVGGPIRIAQEAGDTAQQGWQILALFAAGLSVNLGLLNLLPIPALDGGRILFLGYELLAGRPLDPKKESVVHMAGMAVLLAFMLFITMRDVFR